MADLTTAQVWEVIGKNIFAVLGIDASMSDTSLIVVEPEGEFVTYGIGVSLLDMRDTHKARGRVPVRT